MSLTLLGRWVLCVLTLAVLTGCSTSVPGQAVRSSGSSATPANGKPQIQARDLLLQSHEATPFGPAAPFEVGDTFYTSAKPVECTAALLFKGSPLHPPGPTNYADSAYSLPHEAAVYAEWIGVYDQPLNPTDVVGSGLDAVSACHEFAIGENLEGTAGPYRLDAPNIASDGVLVWAMGKPNWTCNYGLAVSPRMALLVTACESATTFSMAEWVAKRRAEIDHRI